MPLRTCRHFSRTLFFHSFLFVFVLMLRIFWSAFILHFFCSFSFEKSKRRRSKRKKLDRFHCINERKYAHLDERREYLNDSGFFAVIANAKWGIANELPSFLRYTICVCVCMNWRSKCFSQKTSIERARNRVRERGKEIVVNVQHHTNIVFVRILSFRSTFIHSFSVYSFFLFRLTEIITGQGKEWTESERK